MKAFSQSLCAIAALAACSPVAYNVPDVREAQASEVTNCTLVGRVRGIPGVFGPLQDIGLKNARKAALERAKAQGGNTVVFEQVTPGAEVYDVAGDVYAC